MHTKQLFFSHAWRLDNLNRETHKRVSEVVKGLQKYGWTTWFDDDDMIGNMDAAMADGIENCECFIVCLTEEYCLKVNAGSKDPYIRDNCQKEWNYANNRDKLMLPLIMEPCMLNTSNWPPGVVPLYLSSILYIDATHNNLELAIGNIHKRLLAYELKPNIVGQLSEKFDENLIINSKLNINTSRINCRKFFPHSFFFQSFFHIFS